MLYVHDATSCVNVSIKTNDIWRTGRHVFEQTKNALKKIRFKHINHNHGPLILFLMSCFKIYKSLSGLPKDIVFRPLLTTAELFIERLHQTSNLSESLHIIQMRI